MKGVRSGRESVQIHVFKRDGFYALKAGPDCQIGHGSGVQPMGQRRAVRLVAVRPFEDGNPLARRPARFLEHRERIVSFVQYVAEKHQVK